VRADAKIAAALERARAREDLDPDAIAALFAARGDGLAALVAIADGLRAEQAGGVVTYVVNRNINFTNVCIKRCGFCAFSRDYRAEQGYFLPLDEVLRRAEEALALGATEVCVQAGLAPKLAGDYYLDLTRALRARFPALHVHGFSPEEVLYGSVRSRRTIRAYLLELKEAGVGSLPGTSAEILVQSVRDRIAPGRITVAQWETVVRTAHEIGIPTTATIMYGHVETFAERAQHLDLLRRIQHDTGGFTEFVPLSFVAAEAPMWRRGSVPGLRGGAVEDDVIAMHAIARIVLGRSVRNIQASWVKEGLPFAQRLLGAGVNDLGGTLMNESISTSAGAEHGQLLRPAELRAAIVATGRIPRERTTLYALRAGDDGPHPLDALDDPSRLGSYRELTAAAEHRFALR